MVVVGSDNKVKISCHNVESVKENYQLRCALGIVTSLSGGASQD